jgi:hypothetical protein
MSSARARTWRSPIHICAVREPQRPMLAGTEEPEPTISLPRLRTTRADTSR